MIGSIRSHLAPCKIHGGAHTITVRPLVLFAKPLESSASSLENKGIRQQETQGDSESPLSTNERRPPVGPPIHEPAGTLQPDEWREDSRDDNDHAENA